MSTYLCHIKMKGFIFYSYKKMTKIFPKRKTFIFYWYKKLQRYFLKEKTSIFYYYKKWPIYFLEEKRLYFVNKNDRAITQKTNVYLLLI